MEYIGDKPRGVLFGNPQRNIEAKNRTLTFTKTCLEISKTNRIPLILTKDLFSVVRYIKDTNDLAFAKKCVEVIFNTEYGIVKFPDIKND
jgi:hypothetical protein